jgi:hypothetical protein
MFEITVTVAIFVITTISYVFLGYPLLNAFHPVRYSYLKLLKLNYPHFINHITDP